MLRTYWILLAVAGILALTACGGGSTDGPSGDTGVKTYDKLTIVAIPDAEEHSMREAFGAMAKHLQARLGMPVEYVHVQDYAATVTALATDAAQIAWFGAITTAQALQQMPDDLRLIACRDIDLSFVTYFIAHASTNLDDVDNLAQLAEAAEGQGWNLTFGSINSTSSHAMPHKFFLEQTGKSPWDVFDHVAFSGNHDVVRQKVANGEFHVGALSYIAWNRATEQERQTARVIYKTPEFKDYALCTRANLGDELIGRIREAVLDLGSTEDGSKLLAHLGAETFVEADLEQWKPYVDELLVPNILEPRN